MASPALQQDSVKDRFDLFTDDLRMYILKMLDAQQVATMSSVSKHWYTLASSQELWAFMCYRDLDIGTPPPGVQPHTVPVNTTPLTQLHKTTQPVNNDWVFTYKRAAAVQNLKEVTWMHVANTGRDHHPPGLEGHGACAWGRNGMLIWGGFGSIFPEQAYELEQRAQHGFAWHRFSPAGQCPRMRYGHTLTRCGPLGNMAVIIGGMTRGGYRGEILDVAVLVQHPPPSTTAPPGGATHTTVPATRSTAARGGRDGSGTHDGSGARDGTVNEDGSEGGHETQEVDEQEGEMRYEWMIPDIGGPAPHARGYHSAAASPDGTKVYIFGGIVRGTCCNTLAILDVTTWQWHQPVETTGECPPERFGHSSVVWDDKLWVVGGGYGSDLLRSGHDHEDVYCLDLTTMRWSRVDIESYAPRHCMGRCHAALLLGTKLVLFGGSLQLCNDLRYIDLATKRMGEMRLGGPLPCGRLSHTLVNLGNDALALYGGWAPGACELDELSVLHLVPRALWTQEERASRLPGMGSHPARRGGSLLMHMLVGMDAYVDAELTDEDSEELEYAYEDEDDEDE